MTGLSTVSAHRWAGAMFGRGEIAFMILIGLMFGTNVILSLTGPQRIDWQSFVTSIFACTGVVACGLYLRLVKGFPRGAKILVMLGLNTFFGMMMAIFFHMHMPRPSPVLTETLLAMDAWFGYHWPDAVAWVATVPNLGLILFIVYVSSFAQIALLMGMLAYLHRFRDLEAMVFSNAFGLLLVFVIWQSFPNLSQSTYLPIPVETALETHLLTHSAYGARLLEMATQGLPVVDVNSILGQVAFPSYHVVMAALVVWFAQRTPLVWPIVAVNIVMVPAILIHGAHHIADIVGGVVALGVALVPAYALVNRLQHRA